MTDTLPEQHTLPFVSVIVPVYNDAERIQTCISALLAQTYPQECYEVLVVDNGSTDGTRAAIARFPVALLVEDSIQSSYAARNKGLAAARGDIIAFTDSDCTPAATWLAEGVRALHDQDADMAGGNVRFAYSPRPTGAEIYDSLAHLKMEQYVREMQGAITANLFVKRSLFDALGVFPGTMKSGGDMFWTRQATAQGYKLVYAPQAEVAHPARQLSALLKRQFRIGVGLNDLRAKERTTGGRAHRGQPGGHAKKGGMRRKMYSNIKGLLPTSASELRQSIQRDGLEPSRTQFWRLWFAAWFAGAATTLGSLSQSASRKLKVSHGQLSKG